MTSVSIIIPSFRQPHFLQRAIESCLEQDHEDLEVIVIDDRSRDASLGLALSWSLRDSRVRVFEVDQNGGLGKARNIGIAHARGEFLCFLDADDYLLPGSISTRLRAVPTAEATHGEALAGVYGDWQHVGEAVDHPVVRPARRNMTVVSAATFTGENVFICSAPLVRRHRVLEAGGFPEGLKMLEDFGLWARMIAEGAVFAPVDHVVATYRQRPNSMLRGDGVVVMADHVEVINRWMLAQGVGLVDGGAMGAWLADATPYSFGRMSWNVPSVLGTFGGAPGASAVRAGSSSAEYSSVELDDFMSSPMTSGLHDDSAPLAPRSGDADTAVIVHTLEQAIEAVAIAEELRSEGSVVDVALDDRRNWAVSWPLALAGIVPVSTDAVDARATIDLARADHHFAERRSELVTAGVRALWPDQPERSGAIVHVPVALCGYPALDAWVSTALHALGRLGLDTAVVADPEVRPELGGWRSQLLDVGQVLAAEVVVTHSGANAQLLDELAPTVRYEPSSSQTAGARTPADLESRVLEIVSRGR